MMLDSTNDTVEYDIINEIEPFTSDKILIPSNIFTNQYYALYTSSLITFLKSQLAKGNRFFYIEFSCKEEIIVFTKELWTEYLLKRYHNNESLIHFYTDIFHNLSNYSTLLHSLQNNNNLYLRLKFFIYDLLKYNHERLQFLSNRYPEYYFSRFHFSEDEIDFFVHFPTSTGLLYKDLFNEFKKDKNKIELCTSHDLAPFIYNIFVISKHFCKDLSFIKNYKKFKGCN